MTESGTPGQTVGPFFGCGLAYPGANRLIGDDHAGAIRLHGTVYDGVGDGIPDALVELWQPGPDGAIARQDGSLQRDGARFTGWGRAATDAAGCYEFTTVAPKGRPAFFALAVFARGLLDVLFTRAYLPGQSAELETHRWKTLVCIADSGGYRFDIHLQGRDETVFLAFRGER